MKTEKSIIFSACHELTKKLVFGTKFNYHATFSFALKLYNTDNAMFYTACKINAVNLSDIARLKNDEFDVLSIIPFIDTDCEKRKHFDKLVSIGINYGLKLIDAEIYKSEIENGYSDNRNPLSVDYMHKELSEDLKQDFVLFFLLRKEDKDFTALPCLYQVLRAGKTVSRNLFGKEKRYNNFANKRFSELEENGIQLKDEKDDYSDTIAIDSLISDIAKKLPKVHRQLAQDIIRCYCISSKGNVVKKARTQAEIADILGVSIRTVKSVWKEITSLNPKIFRV